MLPGLTTDLALISGTGGGSSPPYGGGTLDTQTVTTGVSGTAVNGNRDRGFVLSSLGSCSSGNSAIYSSAVIRELDSWEDDSQSTLFNTTFVVTGVVANSGWTSMSVGGGTALLRANATYSTAGGNSNWTWFNTGNLFGAAGAVKVVGFS